MPQEDKQLADMNKEMIGIVQRATASKLTASEAEWTNLYFEGLKAKNEDTTVSQLKESGSTLVAHLRVLAKFEAFKDIKPNPVLAAIFAHKDTSFQTSTDSTAGYLKYLGAWHYGPELKNLIITLKPKTPKECFDHYSNPCARTDSLDVELKKLSPECQANIIVGLTVRGQEPLLLKALRKVSTETKKDALDIITTKLSTATTKADKNALQIGHTMIYKTVPIEKPAWAENKPIDAKTALHAANAILLAHENSIESSAIETSTRSVLAGLIAKALSDKSLNASILLLRSLNLDEKELFTHLLDSGVPPNFITTNERTFGEDIVGLALTRKDPEWLKLAISHGLTSDQEKTPLHEKLISTVFTKSVAKATIQEMFKLILQVEEPKAMTEVTESIKAGYNEATEKILTDLYSAHFKKKELDGKLVAPISEMDIF